MRGPRLIMQNFFPLPLHKAVKRASKADSGEICDDLDLQAEEKLVFPCLVIYAHNDDLSVWSGRAMTSLQFWSFSLLKLVIHWLCLSDWCMAWLDFPSLCLGTEQWDVCAHNCLTSSFLLSVVLLYSVQILCVWHNFAFSKWKDGTKSIIYEAFKELLSDYRSYLLLLR